MTKILICIPVRNRFDIARECIPTVKHGATGRDQITVWDDDSDSNPPIEIVNVDCYYRFSESVGIEAMRRRHFLHFSDQNKAGAGYTHLYLTDADALHDPKWRPIALGLQTLSLGAPVCLYNTQAHSRLMNNTISEHKEAGVIYRRVAPGISYLLTAGHVDRVVNALPHLPAHWNWDWTVPGLLGHRMAISRISYCDHIGHGGLHDPGEGYDGGDRATSPTPWLVQKRAEVVARLRA